MKIKYWKIYVFDIIRDHFKTLVNNNTKKPDISDVITFYIIPLLIPIILTYFKKHLLASDIPTLIAALSIFVGFMMTLLMFIIEAIRKCKKEERSASLARREKLLKQTLTNVSFEILLGILIIIFSLFLTINIVVFSWLVVYLLSLFFVTLLMIIKRMYTIINDN